LAVQVRAADDDLRQRLSALDHVPTRLAVETERALLSAVGGGCLAPLGALGEVRDGQLRLRAAYECDDGALQKVDHCGTPNDPATLVAAAAAELRRGVRS
jgi:hydroxymethylbilane synthase